MKDNVEFNIKFIQLIKDRPCLYDYTRCDYSSKNTQDDAWTQIAKTVSESVPDCKERWKNLRGCYTRHLKKSNRRPGPSGKRVKPYYLSDYLSFLDNFTKTRETKDRLSDSDDSPVSERQSPAHLAAERREMVYIDNGERFSGPHHPNKKPKQVFMNDTNGTEMEYYTPQQETVPDNQDPDFAFLYSVLPDMQEMTREQKRRFKMGIIKLAGDILQESTPATSSHN